MPYVVGSVSAKCPICFDTCALANRYELQCRHSYCRTCLRAWLVNRIKERDVDNFKCFADVSTSISPNARGLLVCAQKLSESDVRSILADPILGGDESELSEFARYVRFKRAIADPSLRDCPHDGCLGYQSGSAEQPDMTCATCGRGFCFHHANAHPDKACAVYTTERGAADAEADDAALQGCKRCPHCAAAVQKTEGCNSVRCPICRVSWCWLCGKVVDNSELPTHYQWWNLRRGCANRQFTTPEASETLAVKFSNWAYFFVLGIPSFLVTVVGFIACSCACIPAALSYEQGPCAFFMTMTSLVSFLLAVILLTAIGAPIILPLGVLYLLGLLLCLPCYIAGRRAQRAQARALIAAGAGASEGGGLGAAIRSDVSTGGPESTRSVRNGSMPRTPRASVTVPEQDTGRDNEGRGSFSAGQPRSPLSDSPRISRQGSARRSRDPERGAQKRSGSAGAVTATETPSMHSASLSLPTPAACLASEASDDYEHRESVPASLSMCGTGTDAGSAAQNVSIAPSAAAVSGSLPQFASGLPPSTAQTRAQTKNEHGGRDNAEAPPEVGVDTGDVSITIV